MIISKQVEIKISSKNKSHYIKKGYNAIYGEKIIVNVNDLPPSSKTIIKVKCDVCGNEKDLSLQKYNKNISKYNLYTCSTKCAYVKNKKTNLDKYGTEHHLQSKIIKDKLNNTINDKYGVDNVFQLDFVKEKIINSNLKKHGVEYPQQNKDILNKSNETNLKKYGFKRPGQSKRIQEKQILSCKKNLIKHFKNVLINDIDYSHNNINCYCIKCNSNFDIHIKTLYSRTSNNLEICTNCNPLIKMLSDKENQILQIIKESYNGEILTNIRNIISPYELDIYLPELKLAFEFNGLYWHNELYRDKNYHFDKTNRCIENNIQLIHIWEDDWDNNPELIKSMILNKLGKIPYKIYARKTIIKEISDNKLIRKFLDENHIQGFVGSSIKLGLFYNNELVSLMTFGKKRKIMNSSSNDGEYELLRFCNKKFTTVVGGASKLFKYFIRNYNFKEITTYADRSYSNGNLYTELNFNYVNLTNPNYYYIINNIRKHRFGFRKDILIKEGFDKNKSEHEIMLDRKIYRIYNSGNYKYIYN
jgi:hypothetical protein